jgi:acyl carrier protein
VVTIVAKTLGIEDRASTFTADTALLGALPEFDSMAVVEIATEIEETFGFEIDGSELTADVFATFGSLTAFVDEAKGGANVGGPDR